MDAVGVFAYSDEDGTAAVDLDGHLSEAEIADRFAHITTLANRISEDVALERVHTEIQVLIDSDDNTGRAAHQGPEVDGTTAVMADRELAIGEMVRAKVIGVDGIDLLAEIID